MAKFLSATDVAIELADHAGTLRVWEAWSDRFKEHYGVIADDTGVIEVAASVDETRARVQAVLHG